MCLYGQSSLEASDPEIGMAFPGQRHSTHVVVVFLEKKYRLHGPGWGGTQEATSHISRHHPMYILLPLLLL